MPEPSDDVLAAYEPEIRIFMDAMRYKLRQNAHKGKWEGMSIEQALDLAIKEISELKGAISRGNLIDILMESADVANFMMIVASIATKMGVGPSPVARARSVGPKISTISSLIEREERQRLDQEERRRDQEQNGKHL